VKGWTLQDKKNDIELDGKRLGLRGTMSFVLLHVHSLYIFYYYSLH
jgi:hypothetical protein